MGPEQEIAFGPDRLAQSFAEGFAKLEPLEARLAWIEGRIRPGRIQLHRGEALRHVLERPLGGCVRIGIDRAVGIGVRAWLVGIEISVAAQPLMDLAAEQRVDRFADRLADDVPQRHLDSGQDAHQRNVGPARIAAAVNVAPQGLDPERIGALDMMLEYVLDHRHHRLRAEARRIDLADALDPAGGLELEEQEVAAAERGRRIADDEGLELGDFHARLEALVGGDCILPSWPGLSRPPTPLSTQQSAIETDRAQKP